MLDLWPNDIKEVELKAPVTILREQASLLGAKTGNIVEAEVERLEELTWWTKGFTYGFYIVTFGASFTG